MLKSSSPIKLCGLGASQEYLNSLRLKYLNSAVNKYVPPTLHIIKATTREDSSIYIKRKMKILTEVGFVSHLHKIDLLSPRKVVRQEIQALIHFLNNNPACHGILLQSPVDGDSDINDLLSIISPLKDVDGLCPLNTGKLPWYYLNPNSSIAPCTPIGIVTLLGKYLKDDPFLGKHCLVVGSSSIVGRPLGILLTSLGATVTVANSKTPKALLKSLINQTDILISATGSPHLIRSTECKKGCIVVDVGISRDHTGCLKGDIFYDKVDHLKAFSNVPGGVGPMTTAMLAGNLFKLWKGISFI